MKNRRRAVNSTIQPLTLFGMVVSLTKLQCQSNGSTAELELDSREHDLLLHFFSLNDLNKFDVEAATSLKERICKLALDSIKETFQSTELETMIEMFLKCKLLLEADSAEMDNYQDFCRYLINIML